MQESPSPAGDETFMVAALDGAPNDMSEAAGLAHPVNIGRGPQQRTARKGQLHADAVSALRRMILTGELAPGERLREVVLCTQIGVSRTPVREAFRTLAAEGLIKLLPNRSVVVAELDNSEIADLYEVFGTLEGLAGEIACARITEEQISEIAALQDEMVMFHQKRERANYLKVNHHIHRLIVEAGGNPVLKSTWEILLPRVERARALANLRPERWVEALHEHSMMLAALGERDGPLLSRLLREHFANGLAAIGQGLRDESASSA